jgi:predicted nucleic acid-binding Zn ribbon protein
MKNIPPKHIGEIISSYLKNRNWVQRIDGYSILQSWEEVVPINVARNTKPIKIQNNTLFVRVKNHVWANELRIRKGEIIHLINQKAGKDLIKDIIIKIDNRYFYSKSK